MISRLSALAATFAILGTTSLAIATSAHQPMQSHAAQAIPTVQLPHVLVTAKRNAHAAE